MQTVYFQTRCYAFTRRDRRSQDVEVMIEGSDVFVWDAVADSWTQCYRLKKHQLDVLRKMAAIGKSRRPGQTQLGYLVYGDVYHSYAVVCEGSPRADNRGAFYSLAAARRAAQLTHGGSCTNVRILGCDSLKQAKAATVHDELPRVA